MRLLALFSRRIFWSFGCRDQGTSSKMGKLTRRQLIILKAVNSLRVPYRRTRKYPSPRSIVGLWLLLCFFLWSCISTASASSSSSHKISLPFSARSVAIPSDDRRRSICSETFTNHNQFQYTKPCAAFSRKPIADAVQVAGEKTYANSPWYFLKVALAGGIAGAVGSAMLYPMDAAKTLRQSSPSEYSSVFQALRSLISTETPGHVRMFHLQNVYRGVLPATLGAIPSSALYFGAYESMKTILTRYFPLDDPTQPTSSSSSSAVQQKRENNFANRMLVHGLAAMSGNILSSAVFVPKELIKQQLQYRQAGNLAGVALNILKEKGLGGLYVGYKTTLMRNIPTAVLRFTLYEEFRYRWYTREQLKLQSEYDRIKWKASSSSSPSISGVSPKFFLAGAVAGALASGAMTPIDVLKTRLATGTCPVDVKSCFLMVVKEEGIRGLYSGAGARMVFSGAFSAIGFGTFEWAKAAMGVSSASNLPPKAEDAKSKEATTAMKQSRR